MSRSGCRRTRPPSTGQAGVGPHFDEQYAQKPAYGAVRDALSP